MPSAELQLVKRSAVPSAALRSEASVSPFCPKAESVSFTAPCASWQEFPKYWFRACTFFCSVSMYCEHFSHIEERAIWKA